MSDEIPPLDPHGPIFSDDTEWALPVTIGAVLVLCFAGVCMVVGLLTLLHWSWVTVSRLLS